MRSITGSFTTKITKQNGMPSLTNRTTSLKQPEGFRRVALVIERFLQL